MTVGCTITVEKYNFSDVLYQIKISDDSQRMRIRIDRVKVTWRESETIGEIRRWYTDDIRFRKMLRRGGFDTIADFRRSIC